MAFERNPELKKAQERLQEATPNLSYYRAQVYPTLTATLDSSYRKDRLLVGTPNFGGEPYNSYSADLKLTQPLYRGGAVSAGLSVAHLEQNIREVDLEIEKRNLTRDVTNAFFTVLLRQERVKTLKESRTVLEELLKTARNRYSVGRSRKLEVLQFQTQLALLAPRITSAESDAAVANAQLITLLGEQPPKEIGVAGQLKPADVAQVEALKKKYSESELPELRRLSLSREQAESQKDLTLSTNWPAVDAIADINRYANTREEILNQDSTAWSLGLELRIPIFSGLSSVYQRRIYNSQIAQLEHEQASTRDRIAYEKVRTQERVDATRTNFEASEKALKLAKEALIEAESGFRLGTSNYLDLYNSESNYVEANFSRDQAIYDLITAEIDFFVAYGMPIQELMELLSRPLAAART